MREWEAKRKAVERERSMNMSIESSGASSASSSSSPPPVEDMMDPSFRAFLELEKKLSQVKEK
jgi:hypothetical protein